MAIAFIKSNAAAGTDGTPVTSFTVSLATVSAGSLIVALLKYEGLTTTTSVSDGTTTFTAKTEKRHANNDLGGRCFMLPSSVANGSVTYTITFGAARDFCRMHVYEFSSTGTAAFDAEPAGGGGSGTSTAVSSGNIATTGTDEVVCALYAEYSSNSLSSPQFNGVAAGGSRIDSPAGTQSASWYNILTGTATASATGTITSAAWVCSAIAIKATAGGGASQWGAQMNHTWNRIVQC